MASVHKDHEAMISSTVGTPYMASGQKNTVFTRLPALTLRQKVRRFLSPCDLCTLSCFCEGQAWERDLG